MLSVKSVLGVLLALTMVLFFVVPYSGAVLVLVVLGIIMGVSLFAGLFAFGYGKAFDIERTSKIGKRFMGVVVLSLPLLAIVFLKAHLSDGDFLRNAASDGNALKVRIALLLRSDPNAGLMAAVGRGHIAVTEILLSADANPSATYKNGETVLIQAAKGGHAQIAEMLLSAGANPNTLDNDGDTALIEAAYAGSYAVVQVLLSAGADFSVQTDQYLTGRFLSALSAIFDPNESEKKNWTALDIAKHRNHSEIVRLLEEAGAK